MIVSEVCYKINSNLTSLFKRVTGTWTGTVPASGVLTGQSEGISIPSGYTTVGVTILITGPSASYCVVNHESLANTFMIRNYNTAGTGTLTINFVATFVKSAFITSS